MRASSLPKISSLRNEATQTMIKALLFAILVSSVSTTHAEVKVERLDYHGWSGCFRMSNGLVELVYVPQIGRIMRFARINGPNVLWENSRLAGKTAASAKQGEWANYGGDKLWPAPQSLWNWPPDPILDGSPYATSVVVNALVISGSSSPKSGVRFTRRIWMDSDSTTVHIRNTMTNTSTRYQELALWEIAQTDDPDLVIVPIEVTANMPMGWAPYDEKQIDPAFASVHEDGLHVHRSPKGGFKLGSASRKGVLTAGKHGERFEMFVQKSDGVYVDDGKFLEVYASGDPDKYVELEMTGPLTTLAPTQSCVLDMTWRVTKVR